MKSKLLLLFSLFLLATIYGIAQTQIRSQVIIGGTEDDYLTKLCLDKNGFLAAGNSESDSSKFKSRNSLGGRDIWVVKYSRNKISGQPKKVWDKTIGGTVDDNLIDARTTRDGGYLILGALGIPGSDASNFWLIKLKVNGSIAWQKNFGTDYIYGMDTTNDGGIVLVGQPGLIKTDALGNIQWTKPKPFNPDYPYSTVDQAKDGSYLLASTAGEILKTDHEGNILWTKNYSVDDDGYDFVYSVHKISEAGDGSIFLSQGIYYIIFSPSDNDMFFFDNRLYKLDINGNEQWNYLVSYPGSAVSTYIMSALQTRDGGFLIGSTINLTPSAEYPRNVDLITKLNAAGAVKWTRTLKGGSTMEDIVEPVSNTYLVGSSAYLTDSTGDKTKPPVGKNDYWIVALQDTTSAENINQLNSIAANIKAQALKVYPNPAVNEIYIDSKQPSDILIFNQKGQVVLKQSPGKSGTINIRHLQNGVYYVKDTNTGEVQKIIVQH